MAVWIQVDGGSSFAENPDVPAPRAKLLWSASLDPGTLAVAVDKGAPDDPECVRLDRLASWLTVVTTPDGVEHAVLSNGWKHIRLDVEHGSLLGGHPATIEYRIKGLTSATRKILPLQRFIALCQRGRFSPSLFPVDRRIEQWLLALRCADALRAGASLRLIGTVLWPTDDWPGPGESTKSRARRLVAVARRMMAGDWRNLMVGRNAPRR